VRALGPAFSYGLTRLPVGCEPSRASGDASQLEPSSLALPQAPRSHSQPAAVLEAMRPCREAMIREQRELKAFGVYYNGLSTVIAAIDAVATLLGSRPEQG
jgi:hypothetical protein